YFFFFSSRRRHTRFSRDWSSDVCSSDLTLLIWWPIINLPTGSVFLTTFLSIQGGLLRILLGCMTFMVLLPFIIQTGTPIEFLIRSEERRVGKGCRHGWVPTASKRRGGVV